MTRPKISLFVLLLAALRAGTAFASVPLPLQERNSVTLTDSLERTITLPFKVERIISIQPEISRIIVALGAGDNLVGMDYTLRFRDDMFKLIYPEESRLSLVSMAENNINLEMVLKLKPDVLFVSPYERQIVDSLERKTQIPVVALASLGHFSKLTEETQLIGRILGREQRAAELVSYFDEALQRIRVSLKDVPRKKKPRVYLSFWGSLARTPIFYEPVNAAGGVNVAEKIIPDILGSIGTVVNVEQILRWDPDIILVHGHYPPKERALRVEHVLMDQRLVSLKSVKFKRVHYTFGFWDWWDMAEVLIETMYLAELFYPEKFFGFDLRREGDAVFKKFYGIEDGFSTLCKILQCDEWTHE